ncbi:MAG: family 2 encapsulin nanocompartment cargo protein polyprenyl transferase [Micromonosporaceae bacterium]
MATLTDRTPRTAEEALADCRRLVEPALRAAVDTLPAPIRYVTGYHFGWWDRAGKPTAAGGKALRPTLALLAAEAVRGDDAALADAVPAAVAVELVHNFTLLHDDVMDRDTTRRHRATAWRVFGTSPAILAGDSLLTLALDVLAAADHPAARHALRMLASAVQELIGGQSADLAFERRTDVDLSECVAMAERKTGVLLGCACALGGLYAGATPTQVRRLRGFGAQLGLAFQHVDDLLGIWGEPASTGKPVHSDLRRRKKSLPVVAALAADSPYATELAALYLTDAELSDADLARTASLVDSAGGRAWSREQADHLLDGAMRHLAASDPAPRAGAELAALARMIVHREG